MKLILHSLIFTLIFTGCKPTGFFAKKTAREKYEEKIEKLYPVEGRAWKSAGEWALQNPLPTKVPYTEAGFFHGDSGDVVSYKFEVKAGQKLNLKFVKQQPLFAAFLELWEFTANSKLNLLYTADTLINGIEYASAEGGNYLVRLQPKMGAVGSYKFGILLSPLLAWPIEAAVKARIGSVWGDDRDAGTRKHEGIDIFAKKGSYILAVEDGLISRVSDGGIGGKVIWFSPTAHRFSVYYAHLDTQLVQNGQRVKRGDILGTVGNTGNAKFTPAHLHFGIYSNFGAIDPLAFVQPVNEPKEKTAALKMNKAHPINARFKLYPAPEKKNPLSLPEVSYFKAQSYSDPFYRVILDDGSRAFVAEEDITNKMKL